MEKAAAATLDGSRDTKAAAAAAWEKKRGERRKGERGRGLAWLSSLCCLKRERLLLRSGRGGKKRRPRPTEEAGKRERERERRRGELPENGAAE